MSRKPECGWRQVIVLVTMALAAVATLSAAAAGDLQSSSAPSKAPAPIRVQAGEPEFDNLRELRRFDPVWDTPGANAKGSVPLGNGDIGLNAWVETNGDVCLYISKTDSWDENGRLLKVGKVRLHFEPSLMGPDAAVTTFRQRLSLRDATLEVSPGDGPSRFMVHVWVDANLPVVRIEARVPEATTVTAATEPWRVSAETLKDELISGLNFYPALFPPTVVQPDVIMDAGPERIGWYHRNPETPSFQKNLALQGLDKFGIANPLKNRIFGAVIEGDGFARRDAKTLSSSKGTVRTLNIHVLTEQPVTPGAWAKDIGAQIGRVKTAGSSHARVAHEAWWRAFWNRSWIYVRNTAPETTPAGAEDAGTVLTRGYTLQRYINACAGRGRYPIKFNGSIFTVEAEGAEGFADYRRWGPGYWWQNTRLPYMAMPAAGDFDLMKPFFRMYADILPLGRYRTKLYFGHEGVYFPECIYFWGAVFTETWGDKYLSDMPERIQASGWHKYEWVGGLEMAVAMLDYYMYTQDDKFLRGTALPFAAELLTFFEQHYKTGPDGKLLLRPSQALETWWDCTNALPEVAGLHDLTARLGSLPAGLLSARQAELVRRLAAKLPPVPTRVENGLSMLAPAESFAKKQNVENPELYAVYPFRLYGLGKPDIELAVRALDARLDRGHFGWRQDDLFMALLGLTDRAAKGLLERASQWDKTFRFPAFWGPNYDWTPDQDHGGVLMKTLQTMLLQCDGKAVRLLPAWPKDWEADFKLRAPFNTVLEGKVRSGKVVDLRVTPPERAADIVN